MNIPQLSNFSKLLGIFLVSCAALNSSAFADQLSIVYTDSSGTVQTLVISTGSSDADLKLAASLMGEFGVSLSVVSGGTDSIADIAGAMAAVSVSSDQALEIAKALAGLVPKEAIAIINNVSKQAGLVPTTVARVVKEALKKVNKFNINPFLIERFGSPS